MAIIPPDPATTEWVPVWNPVAVGPMGPQGPQGPAGTAIADAKYWVVEPFGGLVNARALNAFTTGYVRSTAGEPSVVATIPLTDTTGILPDNRLSSNVALKNIDNNFVAQTLASASRIYGNASQLYFYDTTAGADLHFWRFLTDNAGNFYLQALNDTLTTASASIQFRRDGWITTTGFVGVGQYLTNMNASNLTNGLANPAVLGSGTANSSTFLRGDSTWAVPPSAGVPTGVIVLSVTPCPPGWTRVAHWDGLFIRGGPVAEVTGGASTHAHTHTLAIPNHDHGGSTGAVNIGVSISGTTGGAGGHDHPFNVNVPFTTGNNTVGEINVDAGGSGTASRGPHTHSGAAIGSGTTGFVGDHSHSFSGSGGGSGTGSITGQALPISGGIAAANNIPPYVDVIFCYKN